MLTIAFTADAKPTPGLADLHRLACYVLEDRAAGVHHAQAKPFTIWPLLPSPAGPPRALLRLNLLSDRCHAGERRAIARRVERGLRLGDTCLDVTSVDLRERPYASLAGVEPCWSADLSMRSPAYFSRSGRDYLLPDPELVVRTTVQRWNAQAPASLTVDPEQARLLVQRVVLFAHELETVRTELHAGSRRTGFLGWLRLGLPRAARGDPAGLQAARVLGRVVEFLPFCGMGAQTTHGLGAVEVVRRDG